MKIYMVVAATVAGLVKKERLAGVDDAADVKQMATKILVRVVK
jgi:hypothetical protein